jgi:predicted Zn-dependent peptidase
LGHDFGNRYIEAIREVDGAAVLAAAQKYILPDAHVMVAVGAGPGAETGEAAGTEPEVLAEEDE